MSDLKQRFLKFDTLHGLYLVPLAMWALYDLIYFQEQLYIVQSITFVAYVTVEGLRKIFSNPVKREALKVVSRDEYIEKNNLIKP